MLEPFAINKVYPKTVIEQSSMSYSTANYGGRYMMDKDETVMEKAQSVYFCRRNRYKSNC